MSDISTTVGGTQAGNTAERKPKSFTGDLHHLPKELAPLIALPHWVLWRWEKAGDKFTKVPYQPNGYKAKNNDPKTWSSYDTVMNVVADFNGIGFCLFNSDLAAFDIDHCRDPATGAIDPWAADLVGRIKLGANAAVATSGKPLNRPCSATNTMCIGGCVGGFWQACAPAAKSAVPNLERIPVTFKHSLRAGRSSCIPVG